MINWIYFPRSQQPTDIARTVVESFESVFVSIDSGTHDLKSNAVLAAVAPQLRELGFRVESGKTSEKKVSVPVLFGANGKPEKSFDADAYNENEGFVVEVEAGRAVTNNQFLKDLFQGCMMNGVHELAIVVRNTYRHSSDYKYVVRFFDTLYASNRLALPLKGVLLIGY